MRFTFISLSRFLSRNQTHTAHIYIYICRVVAAHEYFTGGTYILQWTWTWTGWAPIKCDLHSNNKWVQFLEMPSSWHASIIRVGGRKKQIILYHFHAVNILSNNAVYTFPISFTRMKWYFSGKMVLLFLSFAFLPISVEFSSYSYRKVEGKSEIPTLISCDANW